MRLIVSPQAWRNNWSVREPLLDGGYYLDWAQDIAAGDVFGTGGTIAGDPFLLNPLYAYVIAPFVALFGRTTVPVLLMQAALAAGTTWLAAAAAGRWSGAAVAAWIAGLCVAFSVPLVHLDSRVSVSGLAAFLVAGTCWSLSSKAGVRERGHGPVAAGIWLGLGVLARPVPLMALPFVAWLFAREPGGGRKAVLLLLAAFAPFPAVSLARNWAVSGEPVVFTAANGHNLHLGNNPDARETGGMVSYQFRFSPKEMHRDSKYRVAHELGREPSRSEVTGFYRDMAVQEFFDHPGASLVHYFHKTRWFLIPDEIPSSADLETDTEQAPLLAWFGFVPTWLIGCIAGAAAVLYFRRRDVLCGPAALVLAHVAACTLAYPLSHYRSPAVPAMAILAALGVTRGWALWRAGSGEKAVAAAAVAVALALAGSQGFAPAPREEIWFVNDAGVRVKQAYDLTDPGRRLDMMGTALESARKGFAMAPDAPPVWGAMFDTHYNYGSALEYAGEPDAAVEMYRDALPWASRLTDRFPWSPVHRTMRAEALLKLGDRDLAVRMLDDLASEYPWSDEIRDRRADIRRRAGF